MSEQDTKTDILTAAMTVFAQKGFAKASMNDIVRASGLSKGGVYWHFKSKDEIVATIFDQFFAAQQTQLDAVLSGEGPVTDKLLQMAHLTGQEVEAWFTQLPSPPEFYALAIRDETLIKSLHKYFQDNEERLAGLIEKGIASGEFRAVDARETAITLTGLFEGLLLLWVVYPAPFDLSKQVETAVGLLLEGLKEETNESDHHT